MAFVSDLLAVKGDTVHTISPDATVYEAIERMVSLGAGSLMVVDQGILGIVTERDYLAKIALKGRSSRETPVRDIMTNSIIFATPGQDVEDVLAVMTEARIRHLPVMDDGKLVGLISIGDCVRAVSSDRKATIQMLSDYITDRYPA